LKFTADTGVPYQVVVVAYTSAGIGVKNKPTDFYSKEDIPLQPPGNVEVERSGTSVSVEWEPVTLFEARGFPTYTVTLEPSSSESRVTRQSNNGVIRVTTNETNVIIGGLDPAVEYDVTVSVRTSAGETVAEPC